MGRTLSRLGGGDRLVAGAALALLLFMFVFSWVGENIAGTLPGSHVGGAGGGETGWEAFTINRWVWLLTALVALVAVCLRTAGWSPPEAIRPGAVVVLMGVVSAILIGFRILHHPAASAGFGGFHVSFGIKPGIWLAFAAALAIAAGGYLQLREETNTDEPEAAAADEPADDAPAAFTGLTVTDAPAKQETP